MSDSTTASQLVETLDRFRFDESSEERLQDGIEAVLRDRGVAFVREARLSDEDRIDFITHDGVGIEVKVDGSAASVLRQLHRYAHLDTVQALVLVTTKRRHQVPAALGKKPVRVVYTRGWCA